MKAKTFDADQQALARPQAKIGLDPEPFPTDNMFYGRPVPFSRPEK